MKKMILSAFTDCRQTWLFAILVLLSFSNHAQIITDIDGNFYDTIRISNQVWTKQNLKVSHYLNGDPIPNITDGTAWGLLTTGARCYYNNDSALYAPVYGALYNLYTVTDSRKLCPSGWHVPGDAEWNILEKYLDNTVDTTDSGWVGLDIGGKLKETGIVHWTDPNTGATNSSGFTALPDGYRDIVGTYTNIGYTGYWWSSTEFSTLDSWGRNISYYYSNINRDNFGKGNGLSVRCVMDIASQIDENSIDMNLQIYPNPASDKITIEISLAPDDAVISICNITGQTLIQQKLQQSKTEIDISRLAMGIYVFKLNNEKLNTVTRFVKNLR